MRSNRFLIVSLLLFVSFVAGCKEKKEGMNISELSKNERAEAEKNKPAAELSRQKLEKLQLLYEQLTDKRTKLESAVEIFDNRILAWKSQIKYVCHRHGITDFAKALENKFISNNLEAIRKAETYRQITRAEISLTRDALMEADRAKTQIALDIVMLDSIEEEKLASIMEELDLTIDKLQPQAAGLVINPDDTKLPPLETVWDQHFSTAHPRRSPNEAEHK